MANRQYFTLAIREGGIWSPQFGDYVRSVVEEECDEYRRDYAAKDIRIIATGGTQAAINQGIAKLNDWRSGTGCGEATNAE